MKEILKEFIDFVIEQQNDDGEQKQILLDILGEFLNNNNFNKGLK